MVAYVDRTLLPTSSHCLVTGAAHFTTERRVIILIVSFLPGVIHYLCDLASQHAQCGTPFTPPLMYAPCVNCALLIMGG
eukprot:4039926-Pleurochrysis_carterae.AAC.1